MTDAAQIRGALLDLLRQGRPRSARDLTRKLMGAGLLSNTKESYLLVKDVLVVLRAEGLATRSGNGKSHHWRLKR